MVIIIGSDHAGFELKEKVINFLTDKYEIKNMGTFNSERCDYPNIAKLVCDNIDNNIGILICGSGIGMTMAANRFNHIRCANCYDTITAELSRKHNDANVLSLGARMEWSQDFNNVINIIETFLNTNFEGGRYQNRITLFTK